MKNFIVRLVKGYGKDKVSVYASSATFYVMVSAVPLVAILFFALSHTSPSLSMELESFISQLLPKDLSHSFYSVMESIKKSPSYLILPFSTITALWGSTKGVGGICRGVESIYEKNQKIGFLKQSAKTLWRSLIFYFVVFFSLIVFSLGKLIYKASNISHFLGILIDLRIAFFIILLSLFFAFLYAKLGDTSLKYTLIGGAFASVGWTLFTYFYSLYVSYSLERGSIYAGMEAVILFMLWLYFCINIILIGAEINKLLTK